MGHYRVMSFATHDSDYVFRLFFPKIPPPRKKPNRGEYPNAFPPAIRDDKGQGFSYQNIFQLSDYQKRISLIFFLLLFFPSFRLPLGAPPEGERNVRKLINRFGNAVSSGSFYTIRIKMSVSNMRDVLQYFEIFLSIFFQLLNVDLS